MDLKIATRSYSSIRMKINTIFSPHTLHLCHHYRNFSLESIRAIACNPNIDLKSIGIYSRSDIQHLIRTQQFQEMLTKIYTIQRQSIEQNLRKLAETAGLSDIYAQDYSGYFKDIKENHTKCIRYSTRQQKHNTYCTTITHFT